MASGMALDTTQPVLVVDDQQMMIDMIVAIVRKIGFESVDHTLDGRTALEMMERTAYGLVISDLNMEPMNGLQLLRSVRANPRLKATPFIMTTGSMATENAIAAKHAGVDNYVLKPFSPAVLREKIEAVL
jgi:two-component system chemotaxis response regulator CheY